MTVDDNVPVYLNVKVEHALSRAIVDSAKAMGLAVPSWLIVACQHYLACKKRELSEPQDAEWARMLLSAAGATKAGELLRDKAVLAESERAAKECEALAAELEANPVVGFRAVLRMACSRILATSPGGGG